jgi:BirA family biotin operon repressor/biotin-[acetyl-CoA-carboxylase] ligase
LEAHDALSSTNDRVRELAGEGAAAFTTVMAETQTAGRGRGGKHWESPAGMGLWMSFLLRPEGKGTPSLTPILVGLATARAIEVSCRGLRPRIKWPNDVLVDGLKVGGILCEGVGPDAVVVGVGLNINQRPEDFPSDLRDHATSLEARGCSGVSRAELAGGVLGQTRNLVDPLPDELDEGLRGELGHRDALAGRTVRTDTGQEGRAIGVARDGALLIEAEGTRHEIRGGGVSIV